MTRGSYEKGSRTRRKGVALAVAVTSTLVIALLLPGASSSAAMAGPQCGDTITSSLVLTHDLVCSGDGLYVQASSNLTLDLNQHSISGSGGTSVGLDVFFSTADVTIENGAVSGFGHGIGFDGNGGVNVTLDHLSVNNNGTGVYAPDLEFLGVVTLSNSMIARNGGDGVAVGFDSSNFRVVNDHIQGNGRDGIEAGTDSLRLIADSFIAHNVGDGANLDATVATVGGNTFLGNGGAGLVIAEDACFFFPFYDVSDNYAVQNNGGGLEATVSDQPCPGPPGSGNAAQNNSVVQCVMIICAKNPGQAKQEWSAGPQINHPRP